MEAYKTIEYKGFNINIHQDEHYQIDEQDDNLFLVAYHRNFWVDRGKRGLVTIFNEVDFKSKDYKGRIYADGYGWKSYEEAKAEQLINKQVRRGQYVAGISQDLAQRIANKGKYEDGSICEEALQYVKDYHIFGLEAYIHSGVSLSISQEGNFPDRQWDVSQLGLVFASKKEFKTRPQARKAIVSYIAYYNDVLAGNVWGFTIEDAQGQEFDSCWGYVGDYDTKGGLVDECKTTIDGLAKDKQTIVATCLN